MINGGTCLTGETDAGGCVRRLLLEVPTRIECACLLMLESVYSNSQAL